MDTPTTIMADATTTADTTVTDITTTGDTGTGADTTTITGTATITADATGHSPADTDITEMRQSTEKEAITAGRVSMAAGAMSAGDSTKEAAIPRRPTAGYAAVRHTEAIDREEWHED